MGTTTILWGTKCLEPNQTFILKVSLTPLKSKEIHPVGQKYLLHSHSLPNFFLCAKNKGVISVLACSNSGYYRLSTAVMVSTTDAVMQQC